MPPADRPRPDAAMSTALAAALEGALDHRAVMTPNAGRPSIHRLNRSEYVNAVRDLLALEIDGRALLPADESAYGFDNNADVLSISPALLDRYLSAATKVSRLAVGDASVLPVTSVYRTSRFFRQDRRMNEDLPFGTRGGMSVKHTFPVDGEYILKIRLQRRGQDDDIRGIDRPQEIEIRLDRVLVKRFSIGGEVPQPQGFSINALKDDPETVRFRQYSMTADDKLDFRLPIKAGAHVVGVTFVDSEPSVPEGVMTPPTSIQIAYLDRRTVPLIDTLQIAGPYNGRTPERTPSRDRIFVCHPSTAQDQPQCAKTILKTLARRAYRRPVADVDVEPLMTSYERARRQGPFESGVQAGLERLLVDPEFLFRVEQPPVGAKPGSTYALSSLEIASRLSFFLWSTIPDDELLSVAERGELSRPAVLEQQVRRMLADSRASALVKNFAAEWLLVRNMSTASPDPELFPTFDDDLREAFQKETELFIEDQIRQDMSVLDLLRANYTFLNQPLADHYGIPNVYGNHFRRVSLEGQNRQGLLSQASILTVTSYAHRTSPSCVGSGFWKICLVPHPHRRLRTCPRSTRPTSTQRQPPCANGWSGTARIRCVRAVTPAWIRWASQWKTSTRSGDGATPTAARPSTRLACCSTAPKWTVRRHSGRRCWRSGTTS